MKLYDVSQLPVLENDRVVGIIDESDLLLAVFSNPERFRVEVRSAMSAAIETVPSERRSAICCRCSTRAMSRWWSMASGSSA